MATGGEEGGRSSVDPWVEELFSVSVQKQEKLRAVTELLGDVRNQTCLDAGGDNGVLSHLLRRRGGTWYSVDLDEAAVSAIRSVVGERVRRLEGPELPFPDAAFDAVVILDLLEHLEDDRRFVLEVDRVLKPGGRLVANVPNRMDATLLHRARERLGIGDARHGHVRPGYTLDELEELLSPPFRLEASLGYSHLPLESLDVLMNAAYALARGGDDGPGWGEESDKGALVSSDQWDRHRSKFRLLRPLRPLLGLVRRLDRAAPGLTPYKIVVRARAASRT